MKRLKEEKTQDLLRVAQQRYEDAKYYCNQKLDAWMTRASFYRGNQYTVQDGVAWYDLENPVGEAREVQNYISPFVRTAVAQRIKSFPNPEVPAASGNLRAIARASAAEKLLKSFIDDNIIAKDEFMRALIWAQVAGGAWLKCYWDPGKGRPKLPEGEEYITLEEDETEDAMMLAPKLDPFGHPVQSVEYEGEIVTEFVDTIDGLCDPTAKRFSEMRYWIHRKLRPISELEDLFEADYFGEPTKGRFMQQPRDEAQSERDYVAGEEEGYAGVDLSKAHDADSVKAQLVEYWQKPTREYPNGLLLVYSGSLILHVGPIPYRPARLPVVLFLGDNVIPSALYADGIVENLIPLQRTLNRIETKKREWTDKILNPHILTPLGSNIDPDLFGEVCGQVIHHTPGLKPEVMNIPNIPQSLFEAGDQLVARMKDISTYSDITKGEAPQGVESGRAIAFLAEHEQTIREPDMILYRQACLDALRHCFYLSKQFYQDGRIIQILGEDGWEHSEFKEDNFDWNIDLAPEPFSGAPNSRALRWSETIEAFQLGVFNDEVPGSKNVRRILSLDHANRSTVDEVKVHRNLARMENLQALRAEQINPVREFHDDEVHLEEHDRFRNSLDYLAMDEMKQAEFDMHCEHHQLMLQQKQMLYAQQQIGAGGKGGMEEEGQEQKMSAPADGGAPAGEPPPQTSQNYVEGQQEQGLFPG